MFNRIGHQCQKISKKKELNIFGERPDAIQINFDFKQDCKKWLNQI